MSWLFYALLAPAVYAVVTFVDKYLVAREVREYDALPIYMGLGGFIAGAIFWVVADFRLLPLTDTLIILGTGVITAWSLIVYYKALSISETSIINILFQMFPVFTLLLSFAILGERITFVQFIGFILILFSSVLVSTEGNKKKVWISAAFALILLYDFLWALSGVLIKFALNANLFIDILVYESWGIGIGGVTIYLFSTRAREAFHKNIKTVTKRALVVVFLNEGLFILAKSLTFFAFTLGPVVLVSVLENTQTFYAIAFGALLGYFFPRVFNEDISKGGLLKKFFASVILFIGILLLR